MTPDDLFTLFDEYIKEARRLQELYKDKIHILVGMETEYITPDYIKLIKELHEKYKFDYIVGAVHHSQELPIDFDLNWFEKAKQKCGSEDSVIHAYLDHHYEIIREIQPAVVGHFDLFRMYCKDKLTESHWEKVRRNIQCIVDYGGLIEFNSAGPKRDIETAHPEEEIVKLMLSMGAKFTISDDAHGPLAVGQLYSELFHYLRKLGIQELHYLERDPYSGHVVTKVLKNPLDHPFWKVFEIQKKG